MQCKSVGHDTDHREVSEVQDFVHLHVHSEYSLRQGILRVSEAITEAKAYGMRALAITDTNALYGAIPFYRAARAAGIKPILGVQLSIARDGDEEALVQTKGARPILDHAVFLAKNLQGYKDLVALVTRANRRERQPFVTFSEVALHSMELFALVGGGESLMMQYLYSGQEENARTWLTSWITVCPAGSLYIDVQDHHIPMERSGLPGMLRMARELDIPLAATNDVHYKHPQDAETQRIFAQVESQSTPRLLTGDQYHFASPDEMSNRFAKLPEALLHTRQIADACEVELPLGQMLLPKYQVPEGTTAQSVLIRAAEAGAVQRYGRLNALQRERLDMELSIINQLGFADYFLVVADFIRFAHKNRISTGPGRGSAAGSMVSYALRITDVDPLANHLLFERFLNPERVSWPDIDTDFEFERRAEVIQYVLQRYGHEYVAQIGTFGTLAARAAIRDTGRVLQIDMQLIDKIAKLVPSHPGVTLQSAHEEVGQIRELLNKSKDALRLWKVAQALEGLPRHTSVHAAGVVISPVPLSEWIPVQPGADGIAVTQYAMEDVEQIGLLKMDFLGLRTLTLIDRCVSSVATRTGQKIDWRKISASDPATFHMLGKGETAGCFQLESAGVRRVLRDLRPTHLEDLVAVISLYRPGPMENIPNFIAAKHGKTGIHYPHPDLLEILKDTYGVIVYQEQIMQIAAKMAGFSLGQADLLRRAVSKKKRDVLDAERGRFVEGCLTKGYALQIANDVYDLIVRFADYGFNKSHACAYAVLAYRTSYLRANHLPDFLAALLSMTMGSAEKVAEYTKDAKKHGIEILPPSVQKSNGEFRAESETTIRAGLLAVRNVGHGAVETIIEARSSSPFVSLVDFLARVNSRICNRKAVESLLLAGAFDAFLPTPAIDSVKLKMLDEAYSIAEEQKQFAGLGLLLDELQPAPQENSVPQISEVLFIRFRSQTGARSLADVKKILSVHPGSHTVVLYDEATRKTRMLNKKWSVQLSPELITVLEEIVGMGNAKIGRVQKNKESNVF